ncbi:Mg/Co/Ni transporter MgtE, CBS domain-containing [hydrothermal vent metagenome]|uniref:Mg/Co/Ni transporter MgtE, CBS domain-containing n=1 Tax=hydrothermal vent metagenome TaxID=652676 RepID=A0A3B0SKH9_9ZZZZ
MESRDPLEKDKSRNSPHGDVFEVTAELVEEISHALRENDSEQLEYLLASLHSADVADIFEQLKEEERTKLTTYYGAGLDPEILPELEDTALDQIIKEMDDKDVVEAISQLESDDAVDVLEDIDLEDRNRIIAAMPDEERLAVEEGLSYPQDSAGRLVQKNVITVPGAWTVGQVIQYLRAEEELPPEFYEIFIVDPLHHPIGMISLSRLIRGADQLPVSEIMDTDPKVVPVTIDQEEVAHMFRQYDLTSMGVVDEDGRLLGMITVDDVVDVIDEEAEEDILRMAGVQETDITESIFEATKNRIVWLLVNLATAILASMVIALFDGSIEQMVALAILMPIVASMGGNAGTQTMTVTVRSLATKDLTSTNVRRVIGKELAIATLNGTIMAIIIGGLSFAYFDSPLLGGVIAAAMVINMIMAGLAGILIPVGLDKMNIDPALASSIFVTTITDVVGFFAFLGLASIILM